MADSVIGAIRVILSADTAAFSAGLKSAENSLGNFAKTAQKLSIAAAAAISTVVVAVGASVQHMIDEADKMNKASQKFGVPVEQLSALKYAADLADVSFESLGKGLGKLSKAILEGATQPTGEAAKGFAALGVSVKDSSGNIKNSEQVFLDIADKFSKMDDGAVKTALSIRIFGRAGADLIPLLNQGRDGIKLLTDEARQLGIVISAETAAKAEKFNDTLKSMSLATNAIGLRIAEALLPTLQKLADLLFDAAKEGSAFDKIVKNLFTEADSQQLQLYTVRWENFVRIVIAAKNILASFTGTAGQIAAALDAGSAAIETNRRNLQALEQAFKQTGLSAMTEMDNLAFNGLPKVKKGLGDVSIAALGSKDALQSFFDSTTKSIAAQQALALAAGSSAGAIAAVKIASEALAIADANHIEITGRRKDALIALINAVGQAAEDMRIKELVQEAIPEWQKLQDKIVEIQEIMAQSPAKADQLAKALAKTQQDLLNLTLTAMSTALGQFGQAFIAFGQHNKKLFEIGKAFATAEAIVNTFKAANMALAAPPGPPFSYVYVAAAIAAGLANVMKIQQTKFQGAALGGSFRVPGGVSGFDSRLVPMMLSPGERVDVTPASRVGEGSRELIIPSIKPKDFFTGETVREMVMAIDQWMKDGGTGIRLAT